MTESAARGPIRALDLEVTRRCNLSCRTCFVVGGRGQLADMTVEDAARFAAWARPRETSVLHLTGGEPFLLPHLEEIVLTGVSAGFGSVMVNTNGLLLTPERISGLARLGVHLEMEVSLDGPRDIHEANRGADTYPPVLRAIDALLDAGLPTSIFTAVTRPLVPRLLPWLEDLRSRWSPSPSVWLVPVGDPGRGESLATPLEKADLDGLNRLLPRAWMLGLKVWLVGNPAATLPLRRSGLEPVRYRCEAASGRLCVLADGSVTPCHPLPLVLGHVERDTIEEVLASPTAQRIASHDFDGCRECADRSTCGGCRAFTLAASRGLHGRDPICEALW